MTRRFLAPLVLVVLILAVAPVIGEVRDFLFETFPEGSLRVLAAGFGLLAATAGIYAAVRVLRDRRHRRARLAGLVLVVLLLFVQGVGFSTGQARVDVAEKAHIVEYGLLALLLYHALRRARRDDPALFVLVACGVALAGTADETVQWLAPRRTGEIRDILLNLSAGVTGLVFALALEPPSRFTWRLTPRRRRLAARGAASAILALGLFVGVVHLGHEIFDPQIGHFRSRWSAAELAEVAAERRARWAADPPTELPIWGVEDIFLTEAAWHAHHRNASYEAGLYDLAWRANRILEKYYDPFLDLESFRGSGRHRYSPVRRRELAAKRSRSDPASYFSPVLRSRIFPWPRAPFLAGLLLLTAAVWTWPRWWPGGNQATGIE